MEERKIDIIGMAETRHWGKDEGKERPRRRIYLDVLWNRRERKKTWSRYYSRTKTLTLYPGDEIDQ